MVFMTLFLGPAMKQRQADTKHPSAIINMCSVYSSWNVMNQPLFSAAKSFEDVFSQNLYYENQELDILTVRHMPTKSKRSPLGVNPEDTV